MNIKSLYILIALILISVFAQAQSDFKNPEEYAKQANKLFESGEFQKAYPFYQTLRSNDPNNPDYNFRLGVCMMYSDPEDKARPIYYFDYALKYFIEDNRIYYYLGRAYHNNYRFSEAKNSYILYKNKAKEKKVKSFDIDRRIEECNNGIALLSHIKLLYVVDKQLVKDATFYKSYDINSSLAKIIAVPNDLKTKYDNKHKSPTFGLFIPEGNMLYYASYGAKGENGLDIYRVKQNPGSGWEKPEKLGDKVNTKYDDAYPFLTPDGKTLYFSSKGHNSMGGYDVFKSEFSLSSFTWSKVENLNFPINTPFDDVFFVPDTSKNMAYFSSDRQSLAGKIYVYHIGLDKQTEEQDLAKAFRSEDEDVADLVKLLKDIADLKTNINIEDYKSKIKKENKSTNIDTTHKEESEIIANNNPVVKLDFDDSKQLDHIVGQSYNSYKKVVYKASKLQKQKNNIGKIAAENEKIASEQKAIGDEKSTSEARKYTNAAIVSRDIAAALEKQIKNTESTAAQMLELSGYLQRYAGLHQKDSVEITYAKINKLKAKVDTLPNVAQEIVNQQQAIIQAKRDLASKKYKENQDALNELSDLKEEMKEYEDALASITDEGERQEYVEMITAMKKEVASKTAKQQAIESDYKNLRNDADETAVALSKIDEVMSDFIAANEALENTPVSEDEANTIEQTIAEVKENNAKYIEENIGSDIAANETESTTLEPNSENTEVNNQEQNSETVAVNETENKTLETNSENTEVNNQEQNSETIAANETENKTIEPNSENTEINNQKQNSETIAANETENKTIEPNSENTEVNNQEQNSETIATNETENKTLEPNSENTEVNNQEQNSETIAANETENKTIEPNSENTEVNNQEQNSEKIAANETENKTIEPNSENTNVNTQEQNSETIAANKSENKLEFTTVGAKVLENTNETINNGTSEVDTNLNNAEVSINSEIANNENKTVTTNGNATELAANENANAVTNSEVGTNVNNAEAVNNSEIANNENKKETTNGNATELADNENANTVTTSEIDTTVNNAEAVNNSEIANNENKTETTNGNAAELAANENANAITTSEIDTTVNNAEALNNSEIANNGNKTETTNGNATELAANENASAVTNSEVGTNVNNAEAVNNSEIANNENKKETTNGNATELAANENANDVTSSEIDTTVNNAEAVNNAEIANIENKKNITNGNATELAANENASISQNTNNSNSKDSISDSQVEVANQIAVNENLQNEANSDTLKNSVNSENNIALSQNIVDTFNNQNTSEVSKQKEFIEGLIDSNNTEIVAKSNRINKAIEDNINFSNSLKNYAIIEYQKAELQNNSANQLINKFNVSQNKTKAEIEDISRIKSEAQQHNMNAIAAYKLASEIDKKNISNRVMLDNLDNIESKNSELSSVTNIDNLQNISNQLANQISSITVETINKDSIENQTKFYSESLNNIDNKISENEKIVSNLESKREQLLSQAASPTQIESISNSIEATNNTISNLKEQRNEVQTNYNKLNASNKAIAVAENPANIPSENEVQIPDSFSTIVNDENVFDNSIVENQVASLVATVSAETNNSEIGIQNTKKAEPISNSDSIYMPIFNDENLNALASKYLEPDYSKIEDIHIAEAKVKSNQIQTIAIADEYANISKSLMADITDLKAQFLESNNSRQQDNIKSLLKDKQKQYIAIKRKQIAADLYSNLMAQESQDLVNKSSEIEQVFKSNRQKIAELDTNTLAINSTIESKNLNPDYVVDDYISKLTNEKQLQQQRITDLLTTKDNISSQYSVQLQKLDQISYEMEQTEKPKKLDKLRIQLQEIEPIANNLSQQLDIVNNQIEDLSDSISQKENIIAAINQHSQNIKTSEIIAENSKIDNVAMATAKEVDLSLFNVDNKLTQDELGMAYIEVPTKPELPYYVTNSIDLVYFDENDIPLVRYMLSKKQASFIQQKLDILQGLDLSSSSDTKKDNIQNEIARLEETQRIVNSKTIELGNLVSNNATLSEDSSIIDENNIIQNVKKQVLEYQQLSQRLDDTAQYFKGYEKQKVIALSKKLSSKADSINNIFIELDNLKNSVTFQENELKIAQLEINAPADQIFNQALMQIEEAKQNLKLAKSNRESAENTGISKSEKQQLIKQALQYEEMALKNQQNAIELYQTQSERIAVAGSNNNNETQTENLLNTESNNSNSTVISGNNTNKTENISQLNNSNNQQSANNDSNSVATEVVKKTNVNSKIIELEELSLIDPTKLNSEDRTNYEVRKADIIGAFVGERNTNINVDFYTEDKPIEVNPVIPNGLTYKVQIAAFRKQIPQNTFGDIKPISAETTSKSAFTRYMVGLFLNYSDANTSKNTLVNKGYKGAFVVPYYNGKRISNAQAKAIINRGEAYTDSKLVSIAEKLKVQNFGVNSNLEQIALSNVADNTGIQLKEKLKTVNNDVVFSVQIGVFGGLRTSARLANTQDLYYDITSKGYYRYFSGKYSLEQAAIEARNKIRANGIKDAFVVAFYKGKKINMGEARKIANNTETNNTVQNQTQVSVQNTNKEQVDNQQETAALDQNIVYKVQIGAFRSPRQGAQLNVLEQLSNNGLDTYTNTTGLLIYTSQAYGSYLEAINARDQIRNNGSSDAFVIAFENGIRISTRIARNKLGR